MTLDKEKSCHKSKIWLVWASFVSIINTIMCCTMENLLFKPQFKPQSGAAPKDPFQMTTFQRSVSNRNGGWIFFMIYDYETKFPIVKNSQIGGVGIILPNWGLNRQLTLLTTYVIPAAAAAVPLEPTTGTVIASLLSTTSYNILYIIIHHPSLGAWRHRIGITRAVPVLGHHH